MVMLFFFFFQAEDGIRDYKVTGVQTCALPISDFMHVMDSDMAPIVGQQVTLTSANAAAVNPRIDLLIQRASTPYVSKELGRNVTECDLVAQLAEGGTRRGYGDDEASSTCGCGD